MKKIFLFTISVMTSVIFGRVCLFAQANQTLSNLTSPTAVSQSLLPGSTTLALGSSTKPWQNMYFSKALYLNGNITLHSPGANNFFAGINAGNTTLTNSYNTGIGNYSLNSITSGSSNTANGYKALFSDTSGYSNSAFGVSSGYSNTTGAGNSFFGYESGYGNTRGNDNTFLGDYSGFGNTTGTSNTFVGWYSGSKNNTGYDNTYIGNSACLQNNGGHDNAVLGYSAAYNNLTGNYNCVFGSFAAQNTTSSQNSIFGYYAANANTSGYDNTIFGYYAMYSNTVGFSNAVFGKSAGYNTKGSNNAFFGNYAGTANTTGNNDTYIGYFADGSTALLTNATALGYQSRALASNQVMLGNTSVTSVKAAGSFVIYSDGRYKKNIKEDVPGLAFINQLRPVTYNYDIHGMNDKIGVKTDNSEENKSMDDAVAAKEKKLYTGFVAQEVEATANKLNYDFSGVYKPQNDKDLYGLSYSDFVVPLVKAVQELSKTNDSLRSQINDLRALMQQVLATKGLASSQNISLPSASLEQNTPNPYNQSTAIHYSVPVTFTSARIMVTDNSGRLLKQIPVMSKGAGIVNVNAGTLSAGTYNYSLIVDGVIVDTKRMVLVK